MATTFPWDEVAPQQTSSVTVSPAPSTPPSTFTFEEVAPVTTESVNVAGIKAIGEAIPQPVKEAAGAVGRAAEFTWEQLPEPVQKAGRATGNFLLDAIDILQRPFQATATYVKALGTTEEAEKGAPLWEILSTENLAKAQQAGIKGLKGQEKASFQEALPDQFRRENPVKSMLLGFLGDALVLDPLKTELISPIFKTVKAAASTGADSVGISSKLADNELFRAFNVNVGDSAKAQKLYNDYRFLKDKARLESVANAKALDNQIKALSKQSDVPVNELKAKIFQDIETGSLSDDAIGELEQRIVAQNRARLEQQRAAGIEVGDLGDTYMPHIATKEADDILNNAGVKGFFGGTPSAKTPQGVAREIEGTVAEINAKNIYGTNKFFQDDPAIALSVADFNAAQAIAGRKFLDDASQFGIKADIAPANYKTIPEIPGLKFEPAVANQLSRSYKAITNQDEINKFLKVYDGAQNWWKMWSLGVRPAYHTKNTIGNLWNSYLGGLTTPKPYADAAAFQIKIAKNNLKGEIAGYPTKELYDAMMTRGVFGQGQYGGDIARRLEDQLQGGNKNPFTLSTSNPILQGGFKLGQTIEDNARIALFIDQLNKGANFDKAASHVRKYLFDYGDVSPFERDVLKRAMPFYTWSRKNIPLQLEALATQPDKINKINLAINNIQQANQVEQPDLAQVPDYIREQAPVYWGSDAAAGTVSAVPLTNLLPTFDLAPLTKFLNTETAPQGIQKGKLGEALSTVTSGISPLIKAPLEYLANYDFFRKKTIQEFEGQTTDFLGIPVPVHLAKLASNIIVLNEIDRANPGSIFGSRIVDPITKEVTTLNSFLGLGTPREARTDLPEEQRLNQYLTGIRIFDIDMGEVERRQVEQMKKDIGALKARITQAQIAEKSREADTAVQALERFYEDIEQFEAEREARMKREK
jgi:hypothetical protein